MDGNGCETFVIYLVLPVQGSWLTTRGEVVVVVAGLCGTRRMGGGVLDAVVSSSRHHSYKHWAPHNSWETTKIKSSIQPIFIYFYVRDVKCNPEFSDWLSPIFWITQSSQSRIRGFLFFRGKSRNRKAAWTLPFIWLADWAKTVWRVGSDLLTLTVGYSVGYQVWTCFEGDSVYRYFYQYF